MALNKTGEKISCVKIPLRHLAKWQEDDLKKRMDCERQIYNAMLGKMLKRMRQMESTHTYRDLISKIDNLYTEIRELKKSDDKESLKLVKEKERELKALYKEKNAILKDYGFTQYDFLGEIANFNCFKENINSTMAQLGVAMPLWESFESRYYPKKLSKKGELPIPKFKTAKFRDTLMLASDNKSGIRLTEDEKDGKSGYTLILSNRQATKKENKIFIPNKDLTDYQKEALNNRIKRVTIKATQVKNKTKYMLIVSYVGLPPITYNKNGSQKHKYDKTGLVSISIYQNTICAINNDEIFIASLLPDDYKQLEEKKAETDKKITYLRYVNNRQNYHKDGRIKRAYTRPNGQKMRKKWYRSNHYMQEVQNKSELFRIEGIKKDLKQWDICNYILGMGNKFIMEDVSFLNQKEIWDDEVGKTHTDDEYKYLKEKRKISQTSAPSALLTKIDNRLKQMDMDEIERIKVPDKFKWFKHDTGISEAPFKKILTVEDEKIPQIIYRAFLLTHINKKNKNDFYDVEECEKDFPLLMEKYKNLEK